MRDQGGLCPTNIVDKDQANVAHPCLFSTFFYPSAHTPIRNRLKPRRSAKTSQKVVGSLAFNCWLWTMGFSCLVLRQKTLLGVPIGRVGFLERVFIMPFMGPFCQILQLIFALFLFYYYRS